VPFGRSTFAWPSAVRTSLEINAAGCQSLRIELHADGGLLLTADTHQTDAGYLRYLLQQDIFRKSIDGGSTAGCPR